MTEQHKILVAYWPTDWPGLLYFSIPYLYAAVPGTELKPKLKQIYGGLSGQFIEVKLIWILRTVFW